ncbi:unnamed protein product (mitochondrion) [Plasmodiophora brassicae]|uniref:NLE domain-containing protein n=1 Tax=Plasmodiophora brassicae TaxID=37360 RepID=A0A0G4IZ53_PLABS|nr:hypothetical protein PBRA_008060 [Plasmodiophora brassicae]SPQ95104.1 unnamed protein product [Plasmodiophora brassicae]
MAVPAVVVGHETAGGITAVGEGGQRAIVQLRNGETGDICGSRLELPLESTTAQLTQLVHSVTNANDWQPYAFFIGDDEIMKSIAELVPQSMTEQVITITFQPQAMFRVRSVGRCTSTLPGHTEAILIVQFSPDGQHLATGSGDSTVRIWQVDAEMPMHTLKGHKDWVQALSWSPDGTRLVSGCRSGVIFIWDPIVGVPSPRRPLSRCHSKYITSFSWQPVFVDDVTRFASAGKDGTIKIWVSGTGALVHTLSGHTACVTCIRWGGSGFLYSASQDRTIKIWDPLSGTLHKTLQGHAHWVNSLSLSTDYALRTGAFDHRGALPADGDVKRAARARYDAVAADGERLVSCSDDFTLFLWHPWKSDKPVARMTGHQQPVNHMAFSPDGRLIASAAFDHSIRIWDGQTGRFLATLRGHVQAVYSVAWSADSRLLVSGSRDSTVKVWEVRTRKLLNDLPGHADEVFALDWSPDGERVASGGRDRVLKFWRR